MGRIQSGGLLLILSIPLALYALWQVNGVVRTDLVLAEPPADRGPTKEQLAEASKKVSLWAGEVHKATAFAEQYRTDAGAVAGPDADANAVVRASASRSADLNDLDQFLSDLERPTFTGKMKGLYAQWMEERKDLKRDSDAVSTWLGRPPPITSAADAKAATNAALELIRAYAGRSKFSDKARAAAWRVQTRLAIVKALKELADKQYRDAVKEKLPLKEGDNAVKSAVETHRELKTQINVLNESRRLADEEKATLDAKTRAEVDGIGAVEDECVAREELLKVFAREDLFTNPNGAAEWLKDVAALYRRTKSEAVQKLIRAKVQEFCEAFIPPAARLDDYVMYFGAAVPRKDVKVKYEAVVGTTVETTREPLSGALDGINEFNLAKKRPGRDTFAVYKGEERGPADLKPTDVSKAAVLFNDERKRVADIPSGPKWTAKSVDQLKKTCEPQKDLVDQLQPLDGAPGAKPPKIWARLSGLAAGMVGCADLFENEP